MSKRLAILVPCVLAAALAGCARSSTANGTSSPAQRNGTFRFTERVPDTSPNTVILEGTITVTNDTIVVEMVPGPCRYDPQSMGNEVAIRYTCGDVQISVERRSPASRANYSTRVLQTVTVRECVRYGTDSRGERVCVEYRNRAEERFVSKSGRLRTVRIS